MVRVLVASGKLIHLDDLQEVHCRLNDCVDIPISIGGLIVTKQLPERLGLHAVPDLLRVPPFIGVVPIALKEPVPELIALLPLLDLLHGLQPSRVLVLALLQLTDFALQLLLDSDALLPIFRVLAYGVERRFQLFVLQLGCFVPLGQIVRVGRSIFSNQPVPEPVVQRHGNDGEGHPQQGKR